MNANDNYASDRTKVDWNVSNCNSMCYLCNVHPLIKTILYDGCNLRDGFPQAQTNNTSEQE